MGLFDWFTKKSTPAAESATPSGAVATLEREPDAVATLEREPDAVTETLAGTWTIDPGHSNLGFTARHAMVTNVRGTFDEVEGSGTLDLSDPANSSVTVVMQASSINTGSADRDGHLRSADFFDVETYPELRFVSTSVERLAGETLRVAGDLTIKDVTRPVSIDFEFTGVAMDPFGNQRTGFEGTTTVNRKDWGLEWNAALETGGVLVSEKIKLTLDISAIKSV